MVATNSASVVKNSGGNYRNDGRPDASQDPTRYRDLLFQMEASLHDKYPPREVKTRMQLLVYDSDFWNYRTDGLEVTPGKTGMPLRRTQR